MLIIEIFDKLLDSIDLSEHIEFARRLPPLSALSDQALLSVGVISSLVVMTSGVLGSHRKKRACILVVKCVLNSHLSISGFVAIDYFLSLFYRLYPCSMSIFCCHKDPYCMNINR